MRYTEYHAEKAVIKDKSKLPEAMEKLAKIEDMDQIPRICCDEYCKYPNQRLWPGELEEICADCELAELFELLLDK